MGSILPSHVALDKTVADYYAEEIQDTDERIVLVASYPTGIRLAHQRYVYQDENLLHGDDRLHNGQKDSESQKAGSMLRALGSQKFSMSVGAMPLIIFDVEGVPNFRSSINSNLEILHPSQRPVTTFYANPSKIDTDDTRIKFAVRVPSDGMGEFPHVIDPDLHYELLSKRSLALAPITTPKCQVFDLVTDAQIQEQSRAKNNQPVDNPLPREIVQEWKDSVLKAISNRPLPFVVKLQQTIFGQGTFICQTESRREELKSLFPGILQRNLNHTHSSNLHLRLATVIISDFVNCKVNENISFAITFFVKRDGTTNFIGCVEQHLTVDNCWVGASIIFSKQEKFEQRFSQTIDDVARFLKSKGYYGMVGIDVLEDEQGKQWVVDLNARPPGSLILCLLKGFFYSARAFDEASLTSSMKTAFTKEEFMMNFQEEVSEGRIVVIAWVEDIENQIYWTSFIVGGETKAAVQGTLKRIKSLCGQPTKVKK